MATPAPVAPTPIAAPLDEFLREVVQTLHAAVNQGIQRGQDDLQAAEKAIEDCTEIIGVIMSGNVQEWIGQE